MSGGLKIEDIRKLPERYQEQVVAKIVAAVTPATPVAGKEEQHHSLKVPVRKLHITGQRAINRYNALMDAVREGVISGLRVEHDHDGIYGFSYCIHWAGEYQPTSVSFKTLQCWRLLIAQKGRGCRVLESLIKERIHDETNSI